ncbi:MAG: twin-arginine translocase TatA/TatE family subunit [Deltaproteobacteria bacterium]|jgi:sec-independent protein translocase protein TatA|nr:twin-arginine translocase TatA/TatE family subunit [Deltaproteobacteria bacterium]MBT6433105.1 twin-arginine translocase TatA/TatE family subunit [Deltaproteobacteria bacterium]MBT6490166.1 twin-arginine translocase TatA/TatE family subunit [Deltaproteobacteria bacterium]
MFGLGTGELAMILVILFFVFGAKRLPALGKALGQGMRDFGRSLKGMDEEEEKSITDEE